MRNQKRTQHIQKGRVWKRTVWFKATAFQNQRSRRHCLRARGANISDCFSDESRFANARLTGDQNSLSLAAVGLPCELNKRIEIRPATNEYGADDRSRDWCCHYGCLLPDEATLRKYHR